MPLVKAISSYLCTKFADEPDALPLGQSYFTKRTHTMLCLLFARRSLQLVNRFSMKQSYFGNGENSAAFNIKVFIDGSLQQLTIVVNV